MENNKAVSTSQQLIPVHHPANQQRTLPVQSTLTQQLRNYFDGYSDSCIRVATWNLGKTDGKSMTGNQSRPFLQQYPDVFRDCDIVFLQELNSIAVDDLTRAYSEFTAITGAGRSRESYLTLVSKHAMKKNTPTLGYNGSYYVDSIEPIQVMNVHYTIKRDAMIDEEVVNSVNSDLPFVIGGDFNNDLRTVMTCPLKVAPFVLDSCGTHTTSGFKTIDFICFNSCYFREVGSRVFFFLPPEGNHYLKVCVLQRAKTVIERIQELNNTTNELKELARRLRKDKQDADAYIKTLLEDDEISKQLMNLQLNPIGMN